MAAGGKVAILGGVQPGNAEWDRVIVRGPPRPGVPDDGVCRAILFASMQTAHP